MEKYICIYFKFFHPNNIFRSNTCAATRSMEWWCWVCIQGNDPNPLPCTCSRYSGIFSYVQLIPLWFHIGRVNYARKQYSHRPNLIEKVKVLLDHPHPLTPNLTDCEIEICLDSWFISRKCRVIIIMFTFDIKTFSKKRKIQKQFKNLYSYLSNCVNCIVNSKIHCKPWSF